MTDSIKDEILVPKGVYKALSELEKRTPIYKVQSAVFASLAKRTSFESANSGIILDCRSRDHVQQGFHAQFAQHLGAVDLTKKLPKHQQCSAKDREIFRKWLRVNTHFREVFLFDASSDAIKSLGDNTFFNRVLRYMGQTSAIPKRVVLLAGGLINLSQNEIARCLLSVDFPLMLVTSIQTYGMGSFVTIAEALPSTVNLKDLCVMLRVSHVINVTNRPCKVESNPELVIHELGDEFLPIKNDVKAKHFYSKIFRILIQASLHNSSFLVIDTIHKGHSAIIIGSALIELLSLSVVDSMGLLRSRLDPPQFDSYAMAAFTYLTDRSVQSRVRIDRAIECLAAKFKLTDDMKPEAGNGEGTIKLSPKRIKTDAERLLEGRRPLSVHEKWKVIEEHLDSHQVPQEHLHRIQAFVTGVFNRILLHPHDRKYQQLKMNNPRVFQVLGKSEVARMIMEAGGWSPDIQSNIWQYDASRGFQSMRDVLVYISNI